ncbi:MULTISPECIES: hypothetical protein [unclassified Streptomyces]|uniref:hypothetical protein n=1 Tax=unclassified Streptomyces TaxID=2593676 RepID=UPI001F5173D7|nr:MULTISPECIES: hypothetical protein [unclassified Streptomyces]
MASDPRKQSIVKLLSDHNVLHVVGLHLLPCLEVAGHALDPELMTRVGDLVIQAKGLSHVIQLVGGEPEILLDDLQKVDLSIGGRRRKTCLNELPIQVGNVKPGPVEVNYSISLVEKLMSRINHLHLSVMERRVELNQVVTMPLGCEGDDLSAFKELGETYVLLPQAPYVGQVG